MAQSLAMNSNGATTAPKFQISSSTPGVFGSASGSTQTTTPTRAGSPTTALDAAYKYGTTSPIQAGNNPGLIAPSTPVKSHTVNNVDGSSTTQTYHAPMTDTSSNNSQTSQSSNSQPTTLANQGLINTNGTIGTSASQNTQQSPVPSSNTFPGYVSALGNQQNSPYNQSAQANIGLIDRTAAGNIPLGQNAQNIATTAGQKISDIGQEGSKAAAGYLSTGTSPVGEGNAAILNQSIAAQQQAVAQGAQTALQGNAQALTGQNQAEQGFNNAAGQSLTGQNYAQGALSNAAGYAQPQGNTAYFGDPLTGGITGQGNNLINTGISQAILQANAGGDPAALRSQILSQYGAPAAQAFDTALIQSKNGSYNPTTASATAQQNASQATQYQGLATQLDTSLKNLGNVSTTATNFLNSTGLLNTTSNPHYNDAINTYIANIKNPGAAATYASVIGDLNNFKSQILSANTGQTPTALTDLVNKTDPATLSAPALQAYLQNIDTLGKQQLSVYQAQSKASGGGGYAGTPATANTNLVNSPNGNLNITENQAEQAAAGLGIGAGGYAVQQLKNLGPEVLSYIAGLVTK